MGKGKKKTRGCCCPPQLQAVCKHARRFDCRDVAEIVDALSFGYGGGKGKKQEMKVPSFKPKPKCRRLGDCIPMQPPLEDRLRFIGHCSKEPPQRAKEREKDRQKLLYSGFNFGVDDYERCYPFLGSSRATIGTREEKLSALERRRRAKRVRYDDLQATDVRLDAPLPVVTHATNDLQCLFSVPSPKTSGEVITAQRASVKPAEMRPPMPAQSGLDLYKPHSGIVVNRDSSFVPEVVFCPGRLKVRKLKALPCHKGGVCNLKTCTKKKCRKNALLRKRLQKRKMQSLAQFASRSTVACGMPGGRPPGRSGRSVCSAKSGRSRRSRRSCKSGRTGGDDDSLCGLEDIPRPEHVHIPCNLKKGMLQTHSLTVLPCTKEKKSSKVHYGILMGSFNMYDSKFGGKSRGRQALTMSVMAYCLAFHYHPKQWTTKLIDNLLDAGDTWYIQCLDKLHDHSAYQGICEVLHFGKKQTLVLNRMKMQVLLAEPDVVGYTMSLDPTIYNLCRGLKAFFKDNRAGVLMTRFLKVVIWKDKVCFYIFDPAGRDARAYSNFASGTAALMNVASLDALAELVLSRTVMEDQKFVLAGLKVLKMADEAADEDFDSDKELTQAEKAAMGFRILSANCAIVNAHIHLGDRSFEDAKFRQAVPIAVVAMTYAKISPPNTWFKRTLDKILRLGNKLYLDCLHPKVTIDMTIDNIPNVIQVGPYSCEIIIYRERVKGQLFTTKECILNIMTGLEEFFSHEYNSGLLEFNNYCMAIWRQKEMYYLFDPYPRTMDGHRSFKAGHACCWMLLNPETLASAFAKNWDYLPATTLFCIHAFKVLKLKKRERKMSLVCTLSADAFPCCKGKAMRGRPQGDCRDTYTEVFPSGSRRSLRSLKSKSSKSSKSFRSRSLRSRSRSGSRSKTKLPAADLRPDEEQMGDIVSLVDSVQDDYVPPVPTRYKKRLPEDHPRKLTNLDSPTVSVTQVVPPWPKPRDKSNELPEPDPDPEPTPPPTPPPPVIPEGGIEEEEEPEEEDEDDEEAMKAKKEELARLKAEEEEARRKAEELPPPMPPPPPTPQPEPPMPKELEPEVLKSAPEAELQTAEAPEAVEREVLLTADALYRHRLRHIRRKMTPPLAEDLPGGDPELELLKPNNFHLLPDGAGIIRGRSAIPESDAVAVLPFTAIMAVITSYKYSVPTWTPEIVEFVLHTAKQLYSKKQELFQTAPVHIIPKIGLGHQSYSAKIEVAGEGVTWQMEPVVSQKFLEQNDRGMITTSRYSCAFFRNNGLFYLFDGSPCNAMGLRNELGKMGGMACLLRFKTLHELIARVVYNKDGKRDEQQFILSKILVRRLMVEPREMLPEDYDYETRMPKSPKSKTKIVAGDKQEEIGAKRPEHVDQEAGYHLVDGNYIMRGTTAVKDAGTGVKACHFVCLVAMLQAAMQPVRTWDSLLIDICIEMGLEIYDKAANKAPCEKRVIKNIIMAGRFINVNVKKIMVVNENVDKKLEQYIRAVMHRLRYVIVRFSACNMVVCQTDGYFHLFYPYALPAVPPTVVKKGVPPVNARPVASATWTLFRSQDDLTNRIKAIVKGAVEPEFYTFELTSMKVAPRRSAMNYRLSPMFRPDENPNVPFLRRRRPRPLVDEKIYWLNIETVPWSRMTAFNDAGFERGTPRTTWKEWDIEFAGDLYSLWGALHLRDARFPAERRGKQYLATCVVAAAMTRACALSAWTVGFLDGIITAGDAYFQSTVAKIGAAPNVEVSVEHLDPTFEMYPYTFNVKFQNVIFGFVYNILPDRFNLSRALDYFFEKHSLGLLSSPGKNIAFGRVGETSYFMYDCQSFGAPVYNPGQGGSYMFKCESLNRLVYCITLTLNIRRHGQQFHLFSMDIKVAEKLAPSKSR